MINYPSEQLWLLYEKLPKNLQEAIFSVETANIIGEIGERYNLKNEEISEIAKYVGYVLLGLLIPNEIEKTLKEDLNIENDLAKKISTEITQFIFSPIKESLEELYKIEIEIEKPLVPEEKPLIEKKATNKDTYRELIE